MGNEEERALEEQLEDQLHDQRDSFAAIEEALTSDPCNPELVSIREELVQAIKDAEEGLLHLKRARLLQEADAVLCASGQTAGEVKAEPLDPANDVEPEPFVEQSFSVGSKCRFRHTDGRWYNGQIIRLGEGDSDAARIAFLTPTTENKLMCRFFLQQRCRFSNSCRLSHGVDVPLSSLKSYVQTQWQQSMVGSTIWASSGNKHDIWREAELESWDDKVSVGKVVFRDNGNSEELGVDSIAISEYAQVTDEEYEESESSSEGSDSSENDEEEIPQGLGFLDSSQLSGVQTETAIFATWENHTRGIASKMMANMGYRQGMGLGVSGQGMLDPITVKKHPAKQSLDYAVESQKTGEGNEKNGHKKRSRGGKRKREKKHAEAARAAREEKEPTPDVFSLINNQLSIHHETINGGSAKKKQIKGPEEGKKVDRRALVAYEDGIKDLKLQVVKLEEMVKRNRNEKVVYEAAMRKLNETRKALTDAEASHASASSAVVSREKEKKWLKF